MTTIIPVASGKGGVGKSVLSSNLGVSLAQAGKTVVLVDLDLGGSNLHTCLGIRNNHPGIGHFIYRHEDSLEALLVETEIRRLFLIPGDALFSGTANLQYFMKQKIQRGLSDLAADFIILDLGSGSAYNTVDFFLLSLCGLIVITPEATSILNAYSFIKTSVYRLLYRSFPPKSDERSIMQDFISGRIEGTEHSFSDIIGRLTQVRGESGTLAAEVLRQFLPRVVLNNGASTADIALGRNLRTVARNNLDIEVEYVGFLPRDAHVGKSILARSPVSLTHPEANYSRAVTRLAQKIIATPEPKAPALFEADEDLQALGEEAIAHGALDAEPGEDSS